MDTVVHGDQVKVYGWYDNEWAYANRLLELVELVAVSDDAARLPGRPPAVMTGPGAAAEYRALDPRLVTRRAPTGGTPVGTYETRVPPVVDGGRPLMPGAGRSGAGGPRWGRYRWGRMVRVRRRSGRG
ncbi:MAG: hypothetical protein QOG20_2167 [Pseudonocardiales bacterium]|nr:hypothetical protein [Pseudonocardiales bacterium]